MAVLDPTQTYTDGQKVYFKAEPPTKYNPTFHTIQAGQLGTTDPALPEEGIVMISNNPWSSPYAIYMKGVTPATPININGRTIPLTNTPYDFSQVLKSGWSYLQSMVDVTHIVEARYVISDYIGEFNTLPTDPYYGYNIKCPPVWFGEYWDSNHPTWGIRVYAIADMIEASGGGDFISEDLNGMTDKLTAVCFDRVDANDNLKGRYYFWCFFNPSTGVITKSIRWKGGTMYDSPLDDGGDDMDFPSLPNADFIKTGLARAYCFDGSQSSISALNDLSNYIWGGTFDAVADTLLSSPIDSVIALNQLPSYNDYIKGGAENLKIGKTYVMHDNSTHTTATVLSREWYIVDCGTIEIPATHGNYLDYEPYTSVDLFLPYIGTVKLNAKDVVGQTLYIKYYIDSLTGQCNCMIKVGTSVKYSFNGSCLTSFPITGANFSHLFSGAFSLLSGLNAVGTAKEVAGEVGNAIGTAQSGISAFDVEYQRSGNISCTAGELGIRTPYALVTRRVPVVDNNYNTRVGQPYFQTATLSSLSGFTIVEEVQLNGVIATQGELDEIETLLKGGVIL